MALRIGVYKDTLANRRGADVAVLALAEGLSGRGYAVEVFEKPQFAERIKEAWDIVVSTGTNELLDLYAWLMANSSTPPRPRFPWPVVQQFHTDPQSQFKWRKFRRNWRVRRALHRVDAIQVLSEEFVPQVAKYGAKVYVIGNWSKYEGLPANEPLTFDKTIIYPAAFQSVKRQDLLIKAFSRLSKDFPDWRVKLLGSDKTKYAAACRKLVARLGLSERVEFCGFSDRLDEEYAKCAFVAFPSASEGFGLVLADAAMFCKPSVTVHDWIGAAKAGGGIVQKPTQASYSDALRQLMSSAGTCMAMGKVAHDFCICEYSREKILDCWVALFENMV